MLRTVSMAAACILGYRPELAQDIQRQNWITKLKKQSSKLNHSGSDGTTTILSYFIIYNAAVE